MLEARDHAGLTQVQVREKLKLAQSTLSELEATASSSGRVVEFARLYGCDPTWLATGEGEPGWAAELALDHIAPSPHIGKAGAAAVENLMVLSAIENKLVQAMRDLPVEQQHALVEDVSARAEMFRRYAADYMKRHGIAEPQSTGPVPAAPAPEHKPHWVVPRFAATYTLTEDQAALFFREREPFFHIPIEEDHHGSPWTAWPVPKPPAGVTPLPKREHQGMRQSLGGLAPFKGKVVVPAKDKKPAKGGGRS